MIGALVGAGLGLASSIMGGISARKARKARESMLAQQQRDNQAWYDRKYNEDPTKRADTQRVLTMMQDSINKRNAAAKGRQAVMGGTEDSITATKEANNEAMANTTSQIIANNEQRKDAIEQQYLNTKKNIQNQQMGLQQEAANSAAATFQGVAGTAVNIASALDGGGGKAKPTTAASYNQLLSEKSPEIQANLDSFGQKNADKFNYPNFTGGTKA